MDTLPRPADLDRNEQIHTDVRAHYRGAALSVLGQAGGSPAEGSCCGPASGCGWAGGETTAFGPDLYDLAERGSLPDGAVLASLGCGNPTAVAELNPGETVLDLGSGGGIDVLLSAARVGTTGRAIGVDMTDEMIELSRRKSSQCRLPEGDDRGAALAGRFGRRRHQQLRHQPGGRQARRVRRDRQGPPAGRTHRRQRCGRPRRPRPGAASGARLLRRLHRGCPELWRIRSGSPRCGVVRYHRAADAPGCGWPVRGRHSRPATGRAFTARSMKGGGMHAVAIDRRRVRSGMSGLRTGLPLRVLS